MEIVLIILGFIALLLFVVWLPFFKNTQKGIDSNNQNVRDETNVELYKEHKVEIEKDYSDGAIDEENYQYLLAELDNSLLQDIAAAEKNTDAVQSSKGFSVLWPIGMSLFIVAFSVVIYIKQGTLETLMATPIASDTNQQTPQSVEQEREQQQAQMLAYIKNLQQHLEENPDDSEAWYNLGQTFVGAGEFDFAITAFKQVMRVEGEHADILGAIAQATYYRNNQEIDEQVQNLIDKALALDINDPSTNILLGMHNFIGQKYVEAIGYWQRVIDANKPGVNIAALKEAVTEAQRRLGMPSTEKPSSSAIEGPQLTVNVTLSDEIAAKLAQSEDKVVFVYAIPTNGQRMPLAALKIMASDLPKTVTLSDANAMSPQSNLSSVSEVNIFAIVSKLGGVGIKSGDYKAEAQHISVENTDTINLVIDSIVE
ncbi:c-type cytochrome biogenesis protein CcmI [Colwellia sp. MSW7]|uniref:C-type cytochrome biogenesis protein CcmI n=1 Tax=Colwellia maritima TaxID=2912588 RepID=A0ABS9X3E6_9GAMM|nr:c-type cytochrome biogenesis protein CcmI [Colwellia maritima]MCI2284694.1 c-type cytochrome biogenesis protein CcmI [Colwellia maritima]